MCRRYKPLGEKLRPRGRGRFGNRRRDASGCGSSDGKVVCVIERAERGEGGVRGGERRVAGNLPFGRRRPSQSEAQVPRYSSECRAAGCHGNRTVSSPGELRLSCSERREEIVLRHRDSLKHTLSLSLTHTHTHTYITILSKPLSCIYIS